jgi:hypothetical protein
MISFIRNCMLEIHAAVLTGVLTIMSASPCLAQCDQPWDLLSTSSGQAFFGVRANINWDPDGPGPRQPLYVMGGHFDNLEGRAIQGIAAFNRETGLWEELGTGSNALSQPLSTVAVTSLAISPNNELIAGLLRFTQGTAFLQIARWNGTSWQTLVSNQQRSFTSLGSFFGEPTTGILSMLPQANGDIIICGGFEIFPIPGFQNIARFNGTELVGYGNGLDGVVFDIALFNGTTLIAGGAFNANNSVTPVQLRGIARWNGTTWVAVNPGAAFNSTVVRSLKILADGSLVAAGKFTTMGGIPAPSVAKWNGQVWSTIGTLAAPGPLEGFNDRPRFDGYNDVEVLGNGQLALARLNEIRTWDGSTWSPPRRVESPRLVEWFTAPSILPGQGANFTFDRGDFTPTARTSLTTGFDALPTRLLAVSGGTELIAMGPFTMVNRTPATGIAKRGADGIWRAMGNGIRRSSGNLNDPRPGVITSAVELPNGDVVVAGPFEVAGSGFAINLARWNGSTWSAFPTPPGLVSIFGVAVLPNGELVVGGDATGGQSSVQRWNGSTWSPLGAGPGSGVRAVAVLPSGNVLAAGGIPGQIQRWNGVSWTGFGIPELLSPPITNNHSLLVVSETEFYLNIYGAGIYRWTPTNEMRLVGPRVQVFTDFAQMISLPENRILVAGVLAGGGVVVPPGSPGTDALWIWNGSTWSRLPTPPVGRAELGSGAALLSGNRLAAGFQIGQAVGIPVSGWLGEVDVPGALLTIGNVTKAAASCGSSASAVGGLLTVTLQGPSTGASATWQVEQLPGIWSTITQTPLDLTTGGTIRRDAGTGLSTRITLTGSVIPVKVRAQVSNACSGPVISPTMQVFQNPADMGEEGGFAGSDGNYDNNDFIVFIARFFALDPAGDIGSEGGSLGSDGAFDNNDFIVFISQFFEGC